MFGIPEAMTSLAAIKGIAEGFVATRDETKVMSIKLDLMKRAFEIQQALNALQDELTTVKTEKAQLQQENLELKKRLDAVNEYELIELIGGAHVLMSKPVSGATHRPPYFCQACHSDGKKSALSFEESAFGESSFPAHLNCQRSKGHQLSLPGGTQAKQLGFAG
ncbi:hypothetical protein N0K08_17505 [Acidovorax sp. Be4]|uniref:Uncharacterized protein n=1 Tax=Acidovorax bellezanensis TaxID=2976702 RepID=A0ABT2PPR8_9BURK|nr:hypothetical protein [Acidovorax sp. Be4]MCT9812443.1 hypothetical protein [Acidovorax sp. Be4]